MQSVRIENSNMALKTEIVTVLIIISFVITIVKAGICHFYCILFHTGESVNNRNVLWRVTFGLIIVIDDAIVVGIRLV